MNTKLNLLAIISFFVIILFSSCENKTPKSFSFAFYNIENLFDTINNEGVTDESYLPVSKVAWNTERYNHKLDNISRVMKSIDSTGFPSLFGICEIENIGVIEDLIAHPDILNANYNILHKDSPDERGIDVALLYDPSVYTPVTTTFVKPDLWENTDSTTNEILTRDILYSVGLVNNSDTLHVFINHWVSRWGGQEKTEPNRIKIAQTIKRITDSILGNNPDANIIIAGDLNDNPTDTSIFHELNALETTVSLKNSSLYNLSLKKFNDGNGSLYYKSWDMFDQIIVSTSLLTGNSGLKVNSFDQSVFKEDWMLYQPKKGPARPSRTASGGRYYGGYSDHLPVWIRIESN